MKIIFSIWQTIFLLKFAIQKPIKLHFNKKPTHSKVISSSSSLFLTFKKLQFLIIIFQMENLTEIMKIKCLIS